MATHRLRPGVAARALLLALACPLCGAAAGDPRTAVAGQSCALGEAVSGSVLADNFVPSMDDLNTNVSANGFGTSAVGTTGPNTVFGLGQCLRDLSALDCKLCFSEVRSLLPKCYPRVGGRLFLDGCFGRYANYSFFGEARGPADATVCGSGTNYTANPRGFAVAVRAALANVTDAAASADGFAVWSSDTGGARAFALAQCWGSLNTTACAQCLRAAAGAVAGVRAGNGGARALQRMLPSATPRGSSTPRRGRGHQVWNHYKDNTVERVIDRSIYEDTIRDEVLHTLQIGLMCAQANPGDRPTMTKVVELLRSHKHDVEIVLSDPPFLNVEGVEDIKQGEQSSLLSTHSAPSVSGSSRSYLSGR
ncbi:hypothetical protein ACQ4PT_020323 [Festuca glaucescens]